MESPQLTEINIRIPASAALIFATAACLLLSACASRIKSPEEGISELKVETTATPESAEQNFRPGERFDAETDELVSKETLKAWRHALAHDEQGSLDESEWKELRSKDESESIEMLASLAKLYPRVSYVKTMMGQIEQHFGKNEQAANYYEEALLQNRHDPVLIFKAAEARRKKGDTEKALYYYHELQKLQPDFPGLQEGEASCLKAAGAKSAEKKSAKHVAAGK